MLVKAIAISDEGVVPVELVSGVDRRVGVEPRAEVDEYQRVLKRLELVRYWNDDLANDTQSVGRVPLPAKGPALYVLSACAMTRARAGRRLSRERTARDATPRHLRSGGSGLSGDRHCARRMHVPEDPFPRLSQGRHGPASNTASTQGIGRRPTG